MEYFSRFKSNTLAGSGNQYFFHTADETTPVKSCSLYKVFAEGSYPYSFLFSNTMDSTFADGSVSRKNQILPSWCIESVHVGISPFCDETSFVPPKTLQPIFFAGQERKLVDPGELFSSDPVELTAKSGEYIYLEITFSGKTIPYHEESIIPSFVYQNGEWIPSKLHPFVSMIGADRTVQKRIAFFGDSITQGIGTPVNSYAHWCAVLAQKLGSSYSYWNLGLGYGRADDAASDGVWMAKAKQSDIVFVCFGVNDILQGYSAEAVKNNLQLIVDKLHEAGNIVVVQTVPPFDYSPEHRVIWHAVNHFIKNELKNAVFVFDCVEVLRKSEQAPHEAKYGGHPDAEGCRVWGESIFDAVTAAKILP